MKRMKKNRPIVKKNILEVKRRRKTLKSKLSDVVNQVVPEICSDMHCLL